MKTTDGPYPTSTLPLTSEFTYVTFLRPGSELLIRLTGIAGNSISPAVPNLWSLYSRDLTSREFFCFIQAKGDL